MTTQIEFDFDSLVTTGGHVQRPKSTEAPAPPRPAEGGLKFHNLRDANGTARSKEVWM